MSATTGIEWTDATWNPVTGCTEVSPGCQHCYARTFAERWRGIPGHHFEHGFDVQLRPDRLRLPLSWRRPRRVFVNSMSDLFHKDVPDDYIAAVFAVMALAERHTFQVLTKRHDRMRSLLSSRSFGHLVATVGREHLIGCQRDWLRVGAMLGGEPLPNVWLGVSVEDQRWADIRIPALLETPAAVRFLSCEPLLGPVDLSPWVGPWLAGRVYASTEEFLTALANVPAGHTPDWVIVGGESGQHARPTDPAWVRSLRDQCTTVGVPFFFKQWGEWTPAGFGIGAFAAPERLIGEPLDDLGHRQIVRRVGKKAAGRELDGRTWDELPEVTR
jgi:protein gp37